MSDAWDAVAIVIGIGLIAAGGVTFGTTTVAGVALLLSTFDVESDQV